MPCSKKGRGPTGEGEGGLIKTLMHSKAFDKGVVDRL